MNQQKVCILVDSGCDVPKAIREQYDIRVLPLKILYPEGEYLDQITITAQEVYNRMPGELPKTSLPDGATIEAALEQAKEDGYEHILVICISSGLSGTCNMVRIVCENYREVDTFVLDTKNISFGSGVFAYMAAKLLEKGMEWHQLKMTLQSRLEDSKVFFCLDTLEYLHKGGRLGLVSALMGTALNLKPIISCNAQGVYYTVAKALGRRKSLQKMLELATAFGGQAAGSVAAILNGNAVREAKEMKPRLLESMGLKELLTEGQISPALVVHTGPGLLGILVVRGGL